MSICTLCKTNIIETSPELWTSQDGEVVEVAHSEAPSAVAETSLGEFEICDSCYQRDLPGFFTTEDQAEIHFQFGLEYRDREQFGQSIKALSKALNLSVTADILAALAYAQQEVGRPNEAVLLYRRALKIDPSHQMSLENLKNLPDA